jgi:1-aminocyclopropane-1-carboxylate deaminase/D-cysteine desulfhydrase-like pyridoxal-dependent ACC family enzyme
VFSVQYTKGVSTDAPLNFPTPIQSILFQDKHFYLKRDDLIHTDFSGNKARKFHYFLDHEFADITKLISYGSSQSNAMYSLSVLAKMRGWEFEYYVDHLSSYLEQNPQGNYQKALQNSMQLHIAKPPKDIESTHSSSKRVAESKSHHTASTNWHKR